MGDRPSRSTTYLPKPVLPIKPVNFINYPVDIIFKLTSSSTNFMNAVIKLFTELHLEVSGLTGNPKSVSRDNILLCVSELALKFGPNA